MGVFGYRLLRRSASGLSAASGNSEGAGAANDGDSSSESDREAEGDRETKVINRNQRNERVCHIHLIVGTGM